MQANNSKQTANDASTNNKQNEHLLSKEICERIRKRKCFADKELEKIDPITVANSASIPINLTNKETKIAKLDDVKPIVQSSAVCSELASNLMFADSLGKLLTYYSHLTNYANQIKMFNSIDYYANLLKANNDEYSNINNTFLTSNLNILNLMSNSHSNKIKQQSSSSDSNKKLTNFSVDALLSSN
jgi:hypothetical protein